MIYKGDVVRLKSGGPKMTVEYFRVSVTKYATLDFACCKWFVGDQLYEGEFDVKTLEVI
jgi:uncharacterized protein YodC (DUF2158 family)